MIKHTVRRNYLSMAKPIIEEASTTPMVSSTTPMVHNCTDKDWDLDGPSPSEDCDACQHHMLEYSRRCAREMAESIATYDPTKYATDGRTTWSEIKARKEEVARLMETDILGLVDHDITYRVERPWWFYMDLSEDVGKTAEEKAEESRKSLEEYNYFKASQEEFGYWFVTEQVATIRKAMEEKHEKYLSGLIGPTEVVEAVSMPDNARDYVRSVDRRSGKEREVEFNTWLAIPKNKRPIFLGGRMGPAVAKADIGSVVVKKCPPSVLLSDIRIIFAKFGGVRDVYRPKDRVTGASKPFVFVEMLKNSEAWSAVDYYATHSLTLDENTFAVEGAGERKTTDQMATIQPITETIVPVVEAKKVRAAVATGSFAALMDTDSDSE